MKHDIILTVILLFLFFCSENISAQKNLTLRSQISSVGHSGDWGYVDDFGNEYALLGNGGGLDIVDVTNPNSPAIKFSITGPSSIWSEVKTWNKYAYVTNETDSGLLIVDLSNLPSSINYKRFYDTIAGSKLRTCHTLQIADGYVYLNSCNVNSGVTILDLADPWNPVYVDTIQGYSHDCYIRNDTLWGSRIVNVSNKLNPVLLNAFPPFSGEHNTWLSDNSKTLFVAYETIGAEPLVTYDVSDLYNIKLIAIYQMGTNNEEVHNVRVINDFLINACYGNRVSIVDASRPDNLIEVGRYEFDGISQFPINCCVTWDVYPYLPSGNIIASDYEYGMYVLTPNYVRACWLEGTVTDSITGAPLDSVQIQLLSTSVADTTNFSGIYKTGFADSGTYTVQFSKQGYLTKTISNIILKNGVLTTLDVKLWGGSICSPINFFQSPNICIGDSVQVGDSIYKTAATYIDTLTAANGCDSIVTTNLSVNPNSINTINITINQGDTLKVGNSIYTASGTYIDILVAFNNCDSIVTTNLTVLTGISQSPISNNLQFQISPNPFSRQTEIKYSLATDTQIKIELYNLLGQKIKTVVNEKQGGGEHHQILEIEKGNAIYFLKISVNGKTFVKRIVQIQ